MPAIAIDNDDIGGVVTSSAGPEAGVWVIAETGDFQTRFAKIVVTDDRGRYLIPDLPNAGYTLWVRGYGLADSAKVQGTRGTRVNLTAVAAASDAEAAKVYPAIAWFSMIHLPTASELEKVEGGMNRYLAILKNGACVGCHQLGNAYTRTIPKELGTFASSHEAWVRRLQSGQAGAQMTALAAAHMGGLPYKYLAEWSDRIAAGAVPTFTPPRPTGIERNIVVTVRDWMNPKVYVHDLTGTDWRNPTVNGYGLIYGAPELSTDEYPILDPVKNVATTFKVPIRDADAPVPGPLLQPSPVWGDERIWTSQTVSHNPIMDEHARVWFTARVRSPNNTPDFCKAGSDHPSAKLFPLATSARQLSVYDPKTKKYTFVDTCFSTQHLRFAEDANDTLWTSNDRADDIGEAVGWLNTKMFDETGDAARSQGWTALVLDTNGNGRRDDYVEWDQPVDPSKDKRIRADFYAVMPNPADGSIWGAYRLYPQRPAQKGALVRLNPGPEPAGDGDRRDLQHSAARLRHPRRRHRSQRGRVVVAGERPPRPVRSPQVQGAAERTEGDRRPLPGRLDVPQVPRPGLSGAAGFQRRIELLHVRGPAEHVRPRREHADLHRQPLRRRARARERPVRHAAAALPDRSLREGIRGTHRRSQRRLEGTRPLGAERRPHAVDARNRQGNPAAGRALPGASGSARQMTKA